MRKKNSKDKKIKNILLNQKGMALLTTLIFVFILVTFCVSLLIMTSNDTKLSALQRDSTKAFYIAEAGIERTLYNLKKDFEISKDWNDDNLINTYILSTADTDGFRKIEYDGNGDYDVTFGDGDGDGTYTVALKINYSNYVTIKSKGKYDNSIRYVQVDVKIEPLSVWDNAIFGGGGASGSVISGNVDIRGSLNIVNEDLGPEDAAINIEGDAGIGNNYHLKKGPFNHVVDLFDGRIIHPPTTIFNEIEVETLNAKLRVKHGKVIISGSATIGDDNPVSGHKGTMDGVYVNNGFGGDAGEDSVHSDNGTKQPYDLGEGTLDFPTLDDDSYKDSGLHLPVDISSINSTTGDFNYNDDKGNSIDWIQSTGILNISGIIVIHVDNIDFSIGDKENPIEYVGVGTIVSKGDISIHGNLLAKTLFPFTDALGLVAYNDLNLVTDSQLKVIGAFYAQETITSAKQNKIAGTFVSKYFDMGEDVPSIYQVPELLNHMPPGMPGGENITYYIYTNNWHETHE